MIDKLAPLKLESQTLKKLVIEAVTSLRSGHFDRLNRTVANLAAAKRLAELPISTDLSKRYSGTTMHHQLGSLAFVLADEDVGAICDIMWDLVIEGVIRPGLGDGKSFHFPDFHVAKARASAS